MTGTRLITSVRSITRDAWAACIANTRESWIKCVQFAGAPGAGWLIGSLLVGNAVVVVAIEGDAKENDSLLGAVIGAPFRLGGETGCYLGWQHNIVTAHRDDEGVWSASAPALGAGVRYSPDPQGMAFIVDRPAESVGGIWSPVLATTQGRSLQEFDVSTSFTATDLAEARAAVVNAWPAIMNSGRVRLARSPLEPFEADAIKLGRVGYSHSLRWGWVANDAFVVFGAALLVASHPQRLARWRAAKGPRPELVNCPSCRYALAGLPADADGVRTCPECGMACGACA